MVKGHDVTERLRSKHSIHKRGVNVCEYVSERERECVCVCVENTTSATMHVLAVVGRAVVVRIAGKVNAGQAC